MSTSFAARVYDVLARRRVVVLVCLVLALVAGVFGAAKIPVDMSFRPTFTGDATEVEATAKHELVFGQVGFRDLVAIVDVGDATSPPALDRLTSLSERVRTIPGVIETRDPLHAPFFERDGVFHPHGLAGPELTERRKVPAEERRLVDDLLATPSWRRLLVGDGNRRVAVMASIDAPNEDFAGRRAVVREFRRVVRAWSVETGTDVQITGYPEVEQVYAREVLLSVARSIAVLIVTMIVLLFVYFRRWGDVLTCLAGVTVAVPIVLAIMALLGQPFSIVNSQVLTLVLIVGIGQALHHQEEYRRRRESGLDHAAANRDAFALLAWPSFMTGLATMVGFAALVGAGMRAIRSFGLSTALGVVAVYVANWLLVPLLISHFYRDAPAQTFHRATPSWTRAVLSRADTLLQQRPRAVALAFMLVTSALVAFGVPRLSIDQKVNQELPSDHPALKAETTYEGELAGFLGPELSIRPQSHDVRGVTDELVAFVNRLCEMPEVRYVASPLDFVPQPPIVLGDSGKPCRRRGGDLGAALSARQGALGPTLQALSAGVIASGGDEAAVIVRVADMGTARSLPFVERVRAAARETMPHAVVRPVGQWWLAQQGMNRLSLDMMLSGITALLVILPIMWFAIRDRRLFIAAIPPTVIPVFATLGFMGAANISVRIGTAMILAISLGLAADDTIHLSVRIRDRVERGSDPFSAVTATLLRTGRPCSFSSYVLIGGFASMTASSLRALEAMGVVAAFTMTFALATDVVLGPAIYLLLARPKGERVKAPEDPTLRAMLASVVGQHPERPAATYRCGLDERDRRTLTWHELTRLALETAEALGAAAGSARTVAVLADTDVRYPILELALGLTGRTIQPLYVESTDEELLQALAATNAELLVVGRSQRERALAANLHPMILDLDRIVRLPGLDGEPWPVLPPEVEPFDTREAQDRLSRLAPRPPDAPLVCLQSTGTTGPARVIEIGEEAIVHAVRALQGEASHPFPRFLSFLPTAHISERLLTLYVSVALAGHTWFGGGLASLADDLRACRPTVLLAPPILLDAMRSRASTEAARSRLGRALLASVDRAAGAMLARRRVGEIRVPLFARVFGWQLRRGAGLDEVRDTFAGTAPLASSLHAWFEAVGIPVRVVYGQTEMAGATSMTPRKGATFGSVGVPLPGVSIRIGPGGELLVRAKSVFTRYARDADASRRTLEQGWLHTGDRAALLPTGEIVLEGRVQALVTARDGTTVDTTQILSEVCSASDGAGAVLAPAPDGGVYLFVESERSPRPDAREWSALATLVEGVDPHGVVRGWALVDGGFSMASGEIGPTGKPRGWRILALRAHALRLRDHVAYSTISEKRARRCEPRTSS